MIERLTLWGLTPGRHIPDIELPGSPQRCMGRAPVEDDSGRVWVLEHLHPTQFDRRERIGRALSFLEDTGFPVPAYLPDLNGHFVAEHGNDHYQLSPFIPGTPLPQPEFIEDKERGHNLGAVLAALHNAGTNIREFDTEPPFVLEDYVNDLMAKVAPRQPIIHDALLPVLDSLAPLFEAWDDLPKALCHGDFHPLNTIWRDQSVAAVIDWEFIGIRPALFDVANCLGCVGIEDPLALVRGLTPALLSTLQDTGCLEKTNFALLPELLIGMRFAWMSEWLRRHDTEMIDIEISYIRLLTNSIDSLLPAWKNILGQP
nr:phosphotransferase [uncultured Pseudodesulfovibrio sp.]